MQGGFAMHIGVIGGLNLDILGTPHAPLSLRDSNPGTVTLRAGGVGHNIGAQLGRMGYKVTMLTALGSDPQSGVLMDLCRQDGIDLSYALHTSCPTCTYLCLHDEGGDMYCAVNDMQAVDQLTPERISPLLHALENASLCVMDCNLPKDTLLHCARTLNMPLFVDPVSAFKAGKIVDALPYLTAIKPNLMEAQSMTGQKDPADCAKWLFDKGVKNVFVSLGEQGVYYLSSSDRGRMPALPLPENLPLTGAGDSLCAGLIEGLLRGLDAKECAALGCQTAHDTLIRLNQPTL